MFLLRNKIIKFQLKHYHQMPRYQSDLVLGCLSVFFLQKTSNQNFKTFTIIVAALLYPPQTLFVVGILFSHCPSVRPCVRSSVTLCFLNILNNHCWIFIKPCKHVHICKTNTLNKKVRARGQFY